jgi:hypothetical protein
MTHYFLLQANSFNKLDHFIMVNIFASDLNWYSFRKERKKLFLIFLMTMDTRCRIKSSLFVKCSRKKI